MRVVKLGGSLAGSRELPLWLRACVAVGGGTTVLVPGGGRWADEVRDAQLREGFDDATAHRLALRAMERYGRHLVALQPGIVPVAGLQAMRLALSQGLVPVWMPHDMVVAEPAIPQSWEMTSDSLAAWLAGQLAAGELLLVKSLDAIDPRATVAQMAERGWVDACFPHYAAGDFRIRLLGKSDCAAAAAFFS